MKVVGIVAEYNPFHRGHEYQIRCAKETIGADYVVIAMSGDFVQRGAPALMENMSGLRWLFLVVLTWFWKCRCRQQRPVQKGLPQVG
nr:nucleotidyltransferase family protein [Ruminococcus sp. AF46-10NS]